jgi:thiamine biosynthesis lipoprotein
VGVDRRWNGPVRAARRARGTAEGRDGVGCVCRASGDREEDDPSGDRRIASNSGDPPTGRVRGRWNVWWRLGSGAGHRDGRIGATAMTAVKGSFRAMGTEVNVIADEAGSGRFDEAFQAIVAIFTQEEARFSRFREDSELSTVNRSGGAWMEVSTPFAEVIGLALDGAASTGGLFDPTVLAALTAAGYDRDWCEIDRDAMMTRPAPVPCGRWTEIEIRDRHVRLPEGVGIDLGGLAKGWTADVAADAAVSLGLVWVLVNAGGDLRVTGDAPPMEIAVEDPTDRSDTLCVIRIEGGALATTSVMQRRWAREQHHLIDPRAGLPARTPVVQATVWEPTCAAAEVASKRATLEGIPALEHVAGILVLVSGEVVMNLQAAA